MHVSRLLSTVLIAAAAAAALLGPTRGHAQTPDAAKVAEASAVLQAFTSDEDQGIPTELLQRAHGIAVIPNVIRGGFFVGGRRGRGVLAVRTASGKWSNPAFITLTSGSIGLQFGAESADVVLVFGNERSVQNISRGRVTLGGDAAAIAGPLGRRSTAAVTARSEVYIYVRSKGLFAGAAFEGARLDVDQEASERFYAADSRAEALGETGPATPAVVLRFIETLDEAARPLPAALPGQPRGPDRPPSGAPEKPPEEAIIYPLD
jgi:lipid-binding SYLF domain-containing protein